VHFDTAQEFFKVLDNKGLLHQQSGSQLFDPKYKQFLADRYVKGTCPKCGNPEAYGDQCERCGSSLNATDLIHPVSTLSGETPTLEQTNHWYFPLNEYEQWLREWILDGHTEWKTHVYGQVKSWLDAGLQPRAVTRDLEWGVPVPRTDAEGKVLYVWFDAPIGYISSTKEWAQAHGQDWEKWWKDPKTKLVHFIGKDNIVFHCIFFPAMLKAHGGFILPENVPANEFLNLEGEKFSTSRNWAVWLHEYLQEVPGKEDVLRFVLAFNMPESKDADFHWQDYMDRNNNELVAVFGNLANRVFVLLEKNFDQKIPLLGNLAQADQVFLDAAHGYPQRIGQAIERFRFKEALGEWMNLARMANKFLTDNEPWKSIKTDPSRAGTVLYLAAGALGILAVTAEPFLPFTSSKLRDALGIQDWSWKDLATHKLRPGAPIHNPGHLFHLIDQSFVEEQKQKLMTKSAAVAAVAQAIAPSKQEIQYEDFSKLDLRIGTIVSAERIPKADKLLKLQVDLGQETRTVVSGIAAHYTPEEVVGRQVSLLVNLAPRKLRGVDSQGMILMAEDAGGKLVFVAPGTAVNNGSTIS
jgi:methionyl-tRNA synthetase